MAEPGISEDVHRFIAAHIRSIEHLEVLLLLHAAEPKAWTAGEVYRAVLSNEHSIEQTLAWLVQAGLVNQVEGSPPQYRSSPRSEEERTLIRTLAGLYKERRVRVIESIYRPPSLAVEEFARAFRIRKIP